MEVEKEVGGDGVASRHIHIVPSLPVLSTRIPSLCPVLTLLDFFNNALSYFIVISYRAPSYPALPWNALSCPVLSCPVIHVHVSSCPVPLYFSCHTTSCHILFFMSHHIMSYPLFHVIPYHVIFCLIPLSPLLCHAVLSYATNEYPLFVLDSLSNSWFVKR
jgi:hypothetical protein